MKGENRNKTFAIIISIMLISLLYGCGDDNDKDDKVNNSTETTADVAGTLYIPATAIGHTYIVMIDDDIDIGNGEIKSVTGLCGTSTSIPYTIEDVPSGTYFAYAVVYIVSSSGEPTTGDYLGYYDTGSSPPALPNATVPTSGVVTLDISLSEIP